MDFVYQFPVRAMQHWDDWIAGHTLGELAAAAEDAGFSAVSSTDHPFPDTEWLAHGGHHAFDPFVSLSFMAAATTRIQLATLLVIPAYRNPYITAKAAATLDKLSGGRLVLGVGAGYLRSEFEVVGASFDDRGPRLDAAMYAMRAAWTGAVVEHDNAYYPAHGHQQLPAPVQGGGPALWFGGNSRAALRRAAEIGDGWLPMEQTEQVAAITRTPALDLAGFAVKAEELRAWRAELGRSAEVSVIWAPAGARDVDGQAAIIAATVSDYARAGATGVVIESRARSWNDCLRELELYRPVISRASGRAPAS